MCYGDDASPPLPPIRGGADDRGRTTLTSADGTELGAYFAHPDAASTRAMIVLPDVRGLHRFYEDLAVRFAEAGMHSIAIDYFGRTAGVGERGEEFPFREHVAQMEPQRTAEDIAAAVEWLRALPVGIESIFTVGFCMGGGISWAQSANAQGLAGCIGFYGVPSRVQDLVPQMKAPLLVLAAGQDFTPVADVEGFVASVNAAGGSAELHVYPDAPHSFFDRGFEQHAGACADAWERILSFVDRQAD